MNRKRPRVRKRDDLSVLERVTWHTRWLAVIAFTLTYPFIEDHRMVVILLVASTAVYNVLRRVFKLYRVPILGSPTFMLLFDYLFLAWLLAVTGGIHSPYFYYLSLPLLTAAYIRRSTGPMPLLVITVASLGLIALNALFNAQQATVFSETRTTIVYCFTFVTLAFLADRLTESHRMERNYALDLQSTAELERSRLVTLINSIADTVLAVDISGTITLYNAAALGLLNSHELNGKNIGDILKLEDSHQNPVDLMAVARSSSTIIQRDDFSYYSKDDSKVNVDISIAPIKTSFNDRSLTNSAYIMVIRDITKQKDLEQQRDEFLSVITHELRTPVATAEAGMSILLTPKMTSLDPEAAKFARLAHDNIVFLAELINDLASISKLESGQYKIEPETLDTNRLLKRLATENRMAAHAKKLRLSVEAPKAALPPVLTSEHEVKEILQNLISNAIKYTAEGGITLGVHAVTSPQKGIVFTVRDTGIGIANTDKPHLFEKFYRSEDYRTRQAGGTGLGLYITQKLAERLSAKIWFKSRLNHGTTFYLFLPPYSTLQQDQKQVIDAQLNSIITSI